MMRLILILLCAVLDWPASIFRAEAGQFAATPISADQARAALDVLNDPAKRAAFSATLNAVIKAQPAAPHRAPELPGRLPRRPPTRPSRRRPTRARSEHPARPGQPGGPGPAVGFRVREPARDPDDAGAGDGAEPAAAVRLGGDGGDQPMARNILVDVSWRAVLVLVIAAAVEYRAAARDAAANSGSGKPGAGSPPASEGSTSGF